MRLQRNKLRDIIGEGQLEDIFKYENDKRTSLSNILAINSQSNQLDELVNFSSGNKLPIIKSKTMKNEEKFKAYSKRKEVNSTERAIGDSMKQTFVCNSKITSNIRINSCKRKLISPRDLIIPQSYLKQSAGLPRCGSSRPPISKNPDQKKHKRMTASEVAILKREMKWKMFAEHLVNKQEIQDRITNGIKKFSKIKNAFKTLIELFRKYKDRKEKLDIPLNHLK